MEETVGRRSLMDRCRNSRVFRTLCALALAIGLTPVQYFALGIARSIPAYADTVTPEGAVGNVQDLIAQEADRSKVGDGDIQPAGSALDLKASYIDAGAKKKSGTKDIDTFFEKYGMSHFITTAESMVPLYKFGDGNGTYVAYIGDQIANGSGSILDYEVTNGSNMDPKIYTDQTGYDESTGLLYVPAAIADDPVYSYEHTDESAKMMLTVQTLVKAAGKSISSNMDGKSDVTVAVDNGNDEVTAVAATQVVKADTFDVTTTIPVATPDTASKISLSDLEVHLNSEPYAWALSDQGDDANAFYDQKTGELTIATMPASVSRIDVKIAGKSILEKLFSVPEAGAAGNITNAAQLATFKYSKKLNFKKGTPDGLIEGSIYQFKGGIHHMAGSLYSGAKAWERSVYRKTMDTVYISAKSTNDGYSRTVASSIANANANYTWDDFVKSKADTGGEGAHVIDGEHGYHDFLLKMPTGNGKLLEKTVDKEDRDDINKGNSVLNFDDWTPVTYNGKKYKYFAGSCTHPSKNVKDMDENADEMFRVLKVDADKGYIVFGVAANGLVNEQQAYAIIKIEADFGQYVAITKSSKDMELWKENKAYHTLSTAKFGLYSDKACTKRVKDLDGKKVTLDKGAQYTVKDGKKSKKVEGVAVIWSDQSLKPAKKLYVKELKDGAPENYEPSKTVIEVKTYNSLAKAKAAAAKKRIEDVPLDGHITVLIHKTTDEKWPIEGAEFTITQYGNTAGNTSGGKVASWKVYSDASGKVDTSKIRFTAGTYKITETKAPEHYYKADPKSIPVVVVKEEKDKLQASSGNKKIDDITVLNDADEWLINVKERTTPTPNEPETGEGQLIIHKKDAEASSQLGENAGTDGKDLAQGDGGDGQGSLVGQGKFKVTNTDEIGHWGGYTLRREEIPHPINNTDGTSYTSYTYKYYHTWHWVRDAAPRGHVQYGTIGNTVSGLPVTQDKSMFQDGVEVFDGDTPYNYDVSSIKFLPTPYEVEEVEAPEGYKLPDNPKQAATIEKDATTPFEVTFEDEIGKGKVIVNKADDELLGYHGNEDKAQGSATLAGAKVTLTNESGAPVLFDGQLYQNGDTLGEPRETDENGRVEWDDVPYGSYSVQEVEPPEGYTENGKTEIETFQFHMKVDEDNPVSEHSYKTDGGLQNKVKHGGFEVAKVDEELHEQGDDSQQQGSSKYTDLAGCEFTVQNTNANPVVWHSPNGDQLIEPNGQFIIRTEFDSSKNMFIATTGENALPVGTYHVTETKAPKGYELSNPAYEEDVEIEDDGDFQSLTFADGDGAMNQVQRGGFKIKKRDAKTGDDPQGNGELGPVTLRIKNTCDHPVIEHGQNEGSLHQPDEEWTIVTDENGYLDTGDDYLPLGTYEIYEETAPDGYLGNDELIATVDISHKGQVIDLTGEHKLRNEVKRGSLIIGKGDNQKHDEDFTNGEKSDGGKGANYWNRSQGDATFADAEYTVYNLSAHPVWFDDNGNGTVDDGEMKATGTDWTDANEVCTLKTAYDANLDAWVWRTETMTNSDVAVGRSDLNEYGALPVGDYVVVETKAPKGYEKTGSFANDDEGKSGIDGNGNLYMKFSIDDEGQEVDLTRTKSALNDVTRGGILVSKTDNVLDKVGHDGEKWNGPQGDATLEGARFEIVNDSAHGVTVDGKWYKKGEVVKTLDTTWDEEQQVWAIRTGAEDLPYGTYTVREADQGNNNHDGSGAPVGYLHKGNDKREQTTIEKVEVREQGVTVVKKHSDGISNDVQRGSIIVGKGDAERFTAQFTNGSLSSEEDGTGAKGGETAAAWHNYAQGDASLKGAEFTIYNRSQNVIWYDKNLDGEADEGEMKEPGDVVDTIKTAYDADLDCWVAKTPVYGEDAGQDAGRGTLPYGTYEVVETKAPTGYLPSGLVENGAFDNGSLHVTVTIRDEGEVQKLYAQDKGQGANLGFDNDVKRGGLVAGKADSSLWDLSGTIDHGQGDATLEGAVLEVVNESAHAVLVGGKWYKHGDVVETITTKWDDTLQAAVARTGERDLPYGTYVVREAANGNNNHVEEDGSTSGAPVGYLHKGTLEQKFQVREDGKTYILDNSKTSEQTEKNDGGEAKGIRNEVQRGSIVIGKGDNAKYEGDLTAGSTSSEPDGSGDAGKGDPANYWNYAEGDATFKGAEYKIYNRSAHEVWVDGHNATGEKDGKWQAEEVVPTGDADTDANLVGTYETKYDKELDAWTIDTGKVLPYGTYDVVESNAPTGYRESGSVAGGGASEATDDSNGKLVKTVTVRDEGEVEKLYWDNGFLNDVQRGGLVAGKADSKLVKFTVDTGEGDQKTVTQKWNSPQGDAHLDGALFEVVNDSAHAVLVDGRWVKRGEVVENLWTQWDDEQQAWVGKTGENDLPYGTYIVREAKNGSNEHDHSGAPEGYLYSDQEIVFEVHGDGQVVVKKQGEGIANDVQRGSILIGKGDKEKYDATTTGGDVSQAGNGATFWNYAEGDATFEGAEFTVYNRSENPIWFDKNDDGKASEDEIIEKDGEVGTFGTKYDKDLDAYTVSTGNRLPYGTYEVVETKAPEGYTAEGSVSGGGKTEDGKLSKTVTIRDEGQVVQLVEGDGFLNEIIKGDVQVTKSDYDLAQGRAQQAAGGQAANPVSAILSAITGNGGQQSAGDAGAGSAATTAPEGTAQAGTTASSTSATGTTAPITVTASTSEGTAPTDTTLSVGTGYMGTALAGIDFEIRNASAHSILVDGKWLKQGDLVATITSHWNPATESYTAETTGKLLPYGTYELTEVAKKKAHGVGMANDAYMVNDSKLTFQVREDGSVVTSDTEGKDLEFQDKIIRNDLHLEKKTDEQSGAKIMPHVPFVITNTDTGEKHVAVTDSNGYLDTSDEWNEHTADTNANDKLLADTDIKSDEVDENAGIWFGLAADGFTAPALNDRGALPYGHYTIEELRCEANQGYALWSDSFTVTRDLTMTEGKRDVNLGTVYDRLLPVIATKATDKADGDKAVDLGRDGAAVVDTVSYSHLTVGKWYAFMARLVDPSTGETLKNAEGAEITGKTRIKADKTDGEVKVELPVDNEELAKIGKATVFERLYELNENDGSTPDEPTATHEEPNDADQTVQLVKIGTTATDATDGDKMADAGSRLSIKDAVAYEGLEPGTEYWATGTLMDKETGKAALDDNGDEITATAKFEPEAPSGTVELEFEFDGKKLAGHELVAFEKVWKADGTADYKPGEKPDDHPVATHEDMDDEGQTVNIVEIRTTATDKGDSDHYVSPTTGTKAHVVDAVKYKGLEVGKTYLVSGTLHVKNDDGTDGGALKNADGTDVAASKTFTATRSDGTEELEFEFDASLIAGKTLVAFEQLSTEGRTVAVHEDIADEDQTVQGKEIHTTATDASDHDKTLGASKSSRIDDEVAYKGLNPGKGYTLVGIVYDKETGLPLVTGDEASRLSDDAKALDRAVRRITRPADGLVPADALASLESAIAGYPDLGGHISWAKKNFRPVRSDDSETLPIDVDSSAFTGNRKLVVYEYLFAASDVDGAGKGNLVTTHEDLSDKDQTVTVKVPKIRTTATDVTDGDHKILPSKRAQVNDKVRYWNLEPGKTYTVTGRLMYSKTGKQAYANDEAITATAQFTADKSDGYVNVKFEFDASGLGSKSLVAYERLYLGEDNNVSPGMPGYIAKHEDKGDKAQTVTVGKGGETPSNPRANKPSSSVNGGGTDDGGTTPDGDYGSYYDKTGETVLPWLLLAAALCAAAVALIAVGYRRRNKAAANADGAEEKKTRGREHGRR